METISEDLDFTVHIVSDLKVLMLLVLKVFFCFLALLNQEEVLLFKGGKDVHELIRGFKVEVILIF